MLIHGSIVTRELDIDENDTFFFNSLGTAPERAAPIRRIDIIRTITLTDPPLPGF
jgi:hypothetical protein